MWLESISSSEQINVKETDIPEKKWEPPVLWKEGEVLSKQQVKTAEKAEAQLEQKLNQLEEEELKEVSKEAWQQKFSEQKKTQIKEKTKSFTEASKDFLSSLKNASKDLFTKVKDLWNKLIEKIKKSGILDKVWSWFSSLTSKLKNSVSNFTKKETKNWEKKESSGFFSWWWDKVSWFFWKLFSWDKEKQKVTNSNLNWLEENDDENSA